MRRGVYWYWIPIQHLVVNKSISLYPPFSLELLAKGDLFGCGEIEGSAGTEVGAEYYFFGILYTPGPTASCTCCTAGWGQNRGWGWGWGCGWGTIDTRIVKIRVWELIRLWLLRSIVRDWALVELVDAKSVDSIPKNIFSWPHNDFS